MKKLLALSILPLLVAGSLSPVFAPSASAVTAADWKAGRIIDDGKFTGLDMSVADIQNFLNNKVPVCDTWGTQPASEYGRSDLTHAQYAASKGWPGPPYVCLKNYHEVPKTAPGPGVPANSYGNGGNPPAGSVSAAQMIYNAAQTHRISPKVLLVKLATESAGPLTTDTWPLQKQYTYAMGAHCPDSGPGGSANCDANYAGFSIQISEAAELLRWYLDGMTQTWWQYKKPFQVNNILWNVAPRGCGGSDVYLQTMGTAALYTYTPYQPNQAALNNMYGTGDNCSAYGNRNFWRVYSDWFGPTNNDRTFFRVIKGDNSSEVYLETYVGKYYVPSYALLAEWGLGPENLQVVSQGYVNSLPFKSNLSNSLTDGSGNLFVVEGGAAHQVLTPGVTATWNVDTARIVDSLGLSQSLPRKEPLGRFMTLKGGDGSVWLVDGPTRHLVDSVSMLYAWGYYPGITNSVSSDLFNRYTIAPKLSQYATVDGSGIWAIDASTKRPFKDVATSIAYTEAISPVTVRASTLGLLNTGTAVTRFVVNVSTGQWFLIDKGSKHYISKGELVPLWGKPANEALTGVSDNFLNNVISSHSLGYTARATSSSAYWLIAKQKHYIATGELNMAITGSSAAPATYSDVLIQSLPIGSEMKDGVIGDVAPYNYPYLLDNGKLRHPATPAARQAWTPQTLALPSDLLSLIPQGSFIYNVTKNESGTAYYTEGLKRFTIPTAYYASWAITSQTPMLSDNAFNRFTDAGAIGDTITTTNGDYIVSSGKKSSLSSVRDTYPATLPNTTSITADAVPNGIEASYLVKSNDISDSRVWFINKGTKIELNFAQQVSLGYLSRGLPIIPISPTTLTAIPTSSVPFSSLIQKDSSGIKLINFGGALGFPNGNTLSAYINSSTSILRVSNSVFDSFALTSSTSRIIYDDAGRYWLAENGLKRYITSWSAYQSQGYPMLPAQYLYGTTMSLLPTGPEIK